MNVIAETVVPSNGQLKPVGTSSLDPVRSNVISSPSILTATLTGSFTPRVRPSSSSQPTSVSYVPSGTFAISWRSIRSE